MQTKVVRPVNVNYAKKCAACKVMIQVGEKAVWDSSDSTIRHPECAGGDLILDPRKNEGGDHGKPNPGESQPAPDDQDGYFHGDDDDFVDAEGGGSEGEGEGDSDSESDSDGDSEGEGDEMENPYDDGTRRHAIIEEHKAGRDPYQELVPKVEAQEEPFVLRKRVDGLGSIPRPMDDVRDAQGKVSETGQKTEFKYEVNRTIAAYEKAKDGKGDGKSEEKKQDKGKPKKPNLVKQCEHFVEEMQRIRLSLDTQAGEANVGRVDHVSYRPVQYGVRMLLNEITPAAALYAFSLHWPKESRKLHGIKEYNPVKDAGTDVPEGEPALLGYVRKLAKARVPIMLIGPAGAGKSRMAEKLAEIDFKGSFASVPLTAGIMPSWLIGSHTVDGWKGRPFLDIYTEGGVFAFEEMDSADPNVLLIINNAIANGYLDNPHDGLRYEMHPDFQPIACCNTLGLGADRFYVGRERLDFATIDRFRMGRVQIGMDNNVDFSILKQEIDSYVG